jgi:hypothetical protein
MKSFRICSLLSPFYLILPFRTTARDRNIDSLQTPGNLTEVQLYAPIFGFDFVWQSNVAVGYGSKTSADFVVQIPKTSGFKTCIRRCYAQSARLGSFVMGTDSSQCWCNTNVDCVEDDIMYSGGVIFSITQKSETNLCSLEKSDMIPSPSPTDGSGTSYSASGSKTHYPTPSNTFTENSIFHTAQPTKNIVKNFTSSNLFYATMSPSPTQTLTTSNLPTFSNSPKPSAKDPIPISVMVRSDSATLSPSVAASKTLLKTNAPTIQPTSTDSSSKLVGNWVEIPPFTVELSSKMSNLSISKDLGKSLTQYLEQYFSLWLTNSTNVAEVVVHLDLANVTEQSRYRSLEFSAPSTQYFQFTGGYAIFYTFFSNVQSQLMTLDKCQLMNQLTLAFSGAAAQKFISFAKELSQRSAGYLGAYFSTLSSAATIPSPCVVAPEPSLSSSRTAGLRALFIFLVMALILVGVSLGAFFIVRYKQRGNRKSLREAEVSISQSNGPSLMKLGTSQSTEVTTNVGSSKKNVEHMLSYFNSSSKISNPKTSVSSGSSCDVEEFAQRFQVVSTRSRTNSQYISPTTSCEEDEKFQGSVDEETECEDESADSWDDITRSLDDDCSNSTNNVFRLKSSLTVTPSYDVPSDEEKIDVWQQKCTSGFNRRPSVPNEHDYHDVMDSFDMQFDLSQSTLLQQQNYANEINNNNRNSQTYTDGMGFLFLP